MLVIKAYLGEEIRRLTLEKDPANFRELVSIIKRLFRNFHRHSFQIKYTDEEQEMITLSQDLELVEALRVVSINPERILRLYLKEIPKPVNKEIELASKTNELIRQASEFVDGLVRDFEKIEIVEQIHHFFEKLFESKQAPPPQNSVLQPPQVEEDIPELVDSTAPPPSVEASEPEVEEKTVMEPPKEEKNQEILPPVQEVVVEKVRLDTSVEIPNLIPDQPVKYSKEVEQLVEMGFSDPLLLQGLLEVNKNDVEQTIVQLLNFVHLKHE